MKESATIALDYIRANAKNQSDFRAPTAAVPADVRPAWSVCRRRCRRSAPAYPLRGQARLSPRSRGTAYPDTTAARSKAAGTYS